MLASEDCISSDYLTPILRHLQNSGLQQRELIAETSLASISVDDLPEMLSAGDLLPIINRSTRFLKISSFALGLQVGLNTSLTTYGQLGFVGMCSASFDEALRNTSRFFPLVTPVLGFDYDFIGERAAIEINELKPLDDPLYGFLLGVFLGGLRSLSLFLLGERLLEMVDESFIELKVDLGRYPELELFQKGQIPVKFSCEKNIIYFSKKLALQPLKNGNKVALISAINACEQLMEKQKSRRVKKDITVIDQVGAIINQSENKFPDLDDVASALCISPRTLSRQLKAEDSSFSKIVMRIRMQRAESLFREENKTIKEIAFLLGYSEVSNFSIAFKKYYGKSPREYRQGLLD